LGWVNPDYHEVAGLLGRDLEAIGANGRPCTGRIRLLAERCPRDPARYVLHQRRAVLLEMIAKRMRPQRRQQQPEDPLAPR
jgi:hypothetical protein